jgi:hypothetical protein
MKTKDEKIEFLKFLLINIISFAADLEESEIEMWQSQLLDYETVLSIVYDYSTELYDEYVSYGDFIDHVNKYIDELNAE